MAHQGFARSIAAPTEDVSFAMSSVLPVVDAVPLAAPPLITHADQDQMHRWVQAAQEGDREAFARIYDHYVDNIYRYLYYRTLSVQLAEDLTSETFIRALRSLGQFRWEGRDLGAWLVTIARNLTADHFKSSAHRREVSTDDLSGMDQVGESSESRVLVQLDNQQLLKAIAQLKPEQRECICLRFWYELSLSETASVMNRTEGAIKQLQFRAVRALARLLE
jgi:RNA polymerase sigma-70 factor (ECF subfamily)